MKRTPEPVLHDNGWLQLLCFPFPGVVPMGLCLGLKVCVAGKRVPEPMHASEKECPVTTLRTRTRDTHREDAELIVRTSKRCKRTSHPLA